MPPIHAVRQQQQIVQAVPQQQQQQQRDVFERIKPHTVVKPSDVVGTALCSLVALAAAGGTAAAFVVGAPIVAGALCAVVCFAFVVCAVICRPRKYRVHPRHIAQDAQHAEQIARREMDVRRYAVEMETIAQGLSARLERVLRPLPLAPGRPRTPPPPYSAT